MNEPADAVKIYDQIKLGLPVSLIFFVSAIALGNTDPI